MDESERDVCPNPDDPEYVELWSRYIHAKDQCMAKEAELVRMYGPNARLDQRHGLETRLNLLTNYLMPVESHRRVEFEIKWFELLHASLEAMHAEIIAELQRQASEKNKKKLFVPGDEFRIPGV
jgi:hypothetical protein